VEPIEEREQAISNFGVEGVVTIVAKEFGMEKVKNAIR